MTYTGGTTGMPKGVMSPIGQTVSGLLATTPAIVGLAAMQEPAEVAPLAAQLAAEGRTMSALPACPLMHATGMGIGALPALTFGGTIVLLEGRGLDPAELWRTVERERVHVITLVGDPFARPLVRALDDGTARDLSSVQLVCSSGAMFSAEVKVALLDHLPGAMIIDFIAATEGTMGMAISTRDAPAATGRFRPTPGVKVFDEHDREVVPGSGQAGIVAIPGAVAEGYYKDTAKTDATFRVIDGVRHSIPGDWATVDADGSISLLGRGSQCINTGGEKVFPEEVEEAIKRHPSVEDCLVFGVVDERFGQRVVAVASLGADAPSTSGSEIVDSLRNELSSYKLPRELVLVEQVPRAPNGKADYPSARDRFEAAQ
jgi:acyl-CoA synthetase (AMP-forming)/AMP-acid ligase II